MKKIAVLLCIVMVVGLCGCSGGVSREATISAKDYNTRLDNMSSSLNERELNDISTMLLGCNVKEFDGIDGWYSDKNIIDRPILVKKILLDGRAATVGFDLKDNCITDIDYTYEDAIFDDLFAYISFNVNIVDFEIKSIAEDPSRTITADEIGQIVASAIESEGESAQFSTSFEHKTEDGIISNMSCGFAVDNIKMVGIIYYSSISYSLPIAEY